MDPEAFPPRAGHPRPDFVRAAPWLSLDGTWEFVPDPAASLDAAAAASAESEPIAVPGPWEESTGRRIDWLTCAWYRRDIEVPAGWEPGRRVWLVVGAAFASTEVWVGDRLVTVSDQGYLPIEADLTDHLVDGRARVLVRVVSPRDKRAIPHGKQRSIPYDDYNGCSFTPSSGIWQSVRLEARPAAWIRSVHLMPAAGLDAFEVAVRVEPAATGTVAARLGIDGAAVTAPLTDGVATLTLPVPQPRLWSPADPNLYDVVVSLETAGSRDAVLCSGGLRSFTARAGRFELNGERIYLRGVLDQGYWPGTGLTPPSDDALVRDLELAASSGFNLVRKHLKAEDPRWLFHADRLGMLVWAEPASTGVFTAESAAAFEGALAGLIERDINHPAIVMWGAYNEEWGLDWDLESTPEHTAAVARAYRLAKRIDPSRPVIDNSGWSHVETDVVDWHYYNEDPAAFGRAMTRLLDDEGFDVWHSARYPLRKTLGVAGFRRDGQPLLNSEYGGGWNSLERAWHTRWQTQSLRAHPENQGYVYTELYDIENETVGIFTFDRRAKDQDGFDQSWAHAETVIIPLVEPLAYGCDLVVVRDAPTTLSVRVSHHGPTALSGTLDWTLDGASGSTPIEVEPFAPSSPVEITVTLSSPRSRLHLAIPGHARTFVDLADAPPPSHLPPDSGWRPKDTR